MQKEVLPKEVIFNLVPILYFIIPIVLGIVTGFVIKKLTFRKKIIYSLIIPISISIVYITIIYFIYNSNKSELQLLTILFIWNSFLIFTSNIIYLCFYKLYLYFYQKRKIKFKLLWFIIEVDKIIILSTSQFVEKPPVKKAEGFCLLVVDKVWNT